MKIKLLLAILIVTLTAGSAFAAKPKPKPKPKPTTSTHHETAGTEQLKGGFGEIGHTYTLGKVYPWNLRLNSVEYSVGTMDMGDRVTFANADQKMMILRFTAHNAQKGEALLRFDTFKITVVDSKDQNFECSAALVSDDAAKNVVEQELKPAQKKDVYTVIAVPAEGEMVKLIIQGYEETVIRYDLRGKAKPLPAPYADPKDPTGYTALATVPAQMGTAYPTGYCSLSVDGVSYKSTNIGDHEVPEGGKFLVISCTAKNLNKSDVTFRFDTFNFKVKDGDGVPIDAPQNMIRATSDKDLEMALKAGEEMKFRTYIPLEKDVTATSFTVQEGEYRAYEYKIQ